MEQKNVDRRVRKTKKLLRQGLTKLLQEKSVKDISVRELADLVDINRGTFYIHYRDIFDMVEQIETEMFEEFNQVLTAHAPQDLKGEPLPFLIDIFRFMADYADMCMALLGKNGDIAFVDKLRGVVRTRCLDDWMHLFKAEQPGRYEFICSYIVSGCIGLIQKWMESGMRESVEEIAQIAEQMIMGSLNPLRV